MADYDVEEGFVYDYKKEVWRKFNLTIGEVTEDPSFSETAATNLDKMLFKDQELASI